MTDRKATHSAVRARANNQQLAVFLERATAAYAQRHIRVVPGTIHHGVVWKTQLKDGHSALIGTALVQFPLKDRNAWKSVHIFLALQETNGTYATILSRVHTALIPVGIDSQPKPGDLIDEEGDADAESFFDNFPLYPNEPDAIISEHKYYEDWAYSIYRRQGTVYKLVYTGCGGGD